MGIYTGGKIEWKLFFSKRRQTYWLDACDLAFCQIGQSTSTICNIMEGNCQNLSSHPKYTRACDYYGKSHLRSSASLLDWPFHVNTLHLPNQNFVSFKKFNLSRTLTVGRLNYPLAIGCRGGSTSLQGRKKEGVHSGIPF